MADAHEFISGFPRPWTLFGWPQTEIFLQIPVQWPVLCILDVLGRTIHDVVNDAATKAAVYHLYKGYRDAQRRNADKDEAAFQEWIAWCRSLGCPI